MCRLGFLMYTSLLKVEKIYPKEYDFDNADDRKTILILFFTNFVLLLLNILTILSLSYISVDYSNFI